MMGLIECELLHDRPIMGLGRDSWITPGGIVVLLDYDYYSNYMLETYEHSPAG